MFDHRNCPLTVDTFEYTHKGSFFSSCNRVSCNCNKGYFESEEEKKGFDASRSKDNITCIYISKTFFGDVLDPDGEVVQSLQMQRFFPHEWLKKSGTSSAKPSASEKSRRLSLLFEWLICMWRICMIQVKQMTLVLSL